MPLLSASGLVPLVFLIHVIRSDSDSTVFKHENREPPVSENNQSPRTFTVDQDTLQIFEHCDQKKCAAKISSCVLRNRCECGSVLEDIEEDLLEDYGPDEIGKVYYETMYSSFQESNCYKNCEECLGELLEPCCECLEKGCVNKFKNNLKKMFKK